MAMTGVISLIRDTGSFMVLDEGEISIGLRRYIMMNK
jgi:hypothetical protein